MRKLSLLGNRLNDLPKNLSSLSFLEELDISNNMIQSVLLINHFCFVLLKENFEINRLKV